MSPTKAADPDPVTEHLKFSASALEEDSTDGVSKYIVKLANLIGPTAKYNGLTVIPQAAVLSEQVASQILPGERESTTSWQVDVEKDQTMVVTERFLVLEENTGYLAAKAANLTLKASQQNGNNRSSVGLAMSSLITQVRAKAEEARRAKTMTPIDQFKAFDTDE